MILKGKCEINWENCFFVGFYAWVRFYQNQRLNQQRRSLLQNARSYGTLVHVQQLQHQNHAVRLLKVPKKFVVLGMEYVVKMFIKYTNYKLVHCSYKIKIIFFLQNCNCGKLNLDALGTDDVRFGIKQER